MTLAHATDGKPIGRRGERTRRDLLQATEACLVSEGLLRIRVIDIAQRAGTSPATFYHYFRSPIDAVLVRAEEVGEDLVPISDLVRADGTSPTYGQVRDLVERFFAHWTRHRALLRARNLAAQEGDPRFRTIRNQSLAPLTQRLADSIRNVSRGMPDEHRLHPDLAAAALVSMLERMAAFHADLERRFGATRDETFDTVASLIWSVISAPDAGGDNRGPVPAAR
jgi:AcrR family transcriptional regulator